MLTFLGLLALLNRTKVDETLAQMIDETYQSYREREDYNDGIEKNELNDETKTE